MGTFLKSLELSAPLLLLTIIGYFLRSKNMLDENTSRSISKLVLRLLFPCSLFIYIYDADFNTAFNIKLVIFLVITALLLIVIMIVVAKLFTKDNKKLGALIQVGVWGNFSIYGLPLAVSIYGEAVGASISITNAFLAPMYNIFAAMLFEHYNGKNISISKQIYKAVFTPLTLAAVLGVSFNLLNVQLPMFIYDTINYMGKSVTAISLINLGSMFNFKINKNVLKLVVVGLLFKLIITPALVLPAAVLFNFRNVELIVIMIFACVPVAVSAFSTAVYYDSDIDITTSVSVYSYLVCSIVIPLVLTILASMGLV